MFLRPILARQLARPHGVAGLLMRPTLNRLNARVNRTVLDLLALAPEHRLLDIGFGGGVLMREALSRTPRGFVAGIEISEPMLKLARGRFRDELASGRAEVKEGSASAIPFPDATFDRVAAVNTLHFWPEPERGLREALRVLRPGGRLGLVLRPKAYLERIRFTCHGFTAWEDGALQALIERAGFTDVSVQQREDRKMGMQIALAVRPPAP
jgi:ubiquinone/menaquinone biosynthesis C-methylase UbiE